MRIIHAEKDEYATVSSNIASLPLSTEPLQGLLDDMLDLKARIESGAEQEIAGLTTEGTSRDRLYSIRNLLDYIVMRREDLRPLQDRLARAGLSSLGRGEPHVLTNIDCIIDVLSRAVLHHSCASRGPARTVEHESGHHLLRLRAQRIFGKAPVERSEYIMVTMPTEAADDFGVVNRLVAAGMDTARINCAHDDESIWRRMIDNIRRAAEQHGRSCRILMDLGGHKVRTTRLVIRGHADERNAKQTRRIHRNDWLVLCEDGGSLSLYEALFDVRIEATVACTSPDIVNRLRQGQTVWVDDGKIGAVIREKRGDAALLQVNKVGPKGARIKEEKGLNFPDTRLDLPVLSGKDLEDLRFVTQHADMVGLSFAERPEDVLYLHDQLKRYGAAAMPIIAKIETAHAVQSLPHIVAGSLAANIELGIMIARGDLAIELGSVRMAEIQEEMLWLCEAAHVPVIWATQVLESLVKKGLASRPELTDAAMAVRAECVMLNKGRYIEHAVGILSDILQRMEAHQFKKISRLRALHW